MTRLGDLRTAYDAQQIALVSWLRDLPAEVADRPSRLAGWNVQQLAFHTTEVPRALIDAIAAEPTAERPLSIADYTAKWRASAPHIAQRDRDAASGLSISDIASRHDAEGAALHGALDQVDADRVIAARRGPIRVVDMLTTRVNELVVHSLDLSASVADLQPVEIDGRALGISCRMLTAILAERVPGRTVEVRVPPYAAVQCVGGPRHTRGTPANVVEAPPVTWVELATGRLGWAEARSAGAVSASGERADISEYLPVLS
jgi:uncharacterized protein (TIGR03083 family)